MAERLIARGLFVTTEVRHGTPAGEIMRAAAEQKPDVTAMATHARDTAGWFCLCSVAESVLRESGLPLLLVRPDEAAVEAAIEAAKETAEQTRVEAPAPPPIWRRPISGLMTPIPVAAREDTPLEEVAHRMLDYRSGVVPVVNDRGHQVGIITTADLTGHDSRTPLSGYQVVQCIQPVASSEVFDQVCAAGRSLTASEIMSRPIVARQDGPAAEVARRMLSRDLNHVPVVRDGVPVGLVARLDLLRLLPCLTRDSHLLARCRAAG